MSGLEVWIPVVLAIVTPTVGGFGWMVKVRWDRRIAREALEEKRRQDELDRLRSEVREAWERVEKLQGKLESLLVDAAARAQDDKREKAELVTVLAKFHELSSAMVAAMAHAKGTL